MRTRTHSVVGGGGMFWAAGFLGFWEPHLVKGVVMVVVVAFGCKGCIIPRTSGRESPGCSLELWKSRRTNIGMWFDIRRQNHREGRCVSDNSSEKSRR